MKVKSANIQVGDLIIVEKVRGVSAVCVNGESLLSHHDAGVQSVALIECSLFAVPFSSSAEEKSLSLS